jgi:hypothetical protein
VVGLEKLLDNSNDLDASNHELNLMTQLSLRYSNTLLAPRSGWRETTGYLRNTATVLLPTKKIVMPQQLADSQELQEQQPVVAQPEQRPEMNQMVVEDKSGETKENEIAVAILCNGICVPTLTSILEKNSSLIVEHYSIFPVGCIRHNKCQISLQEGDITSGHTSCRTCCPSSTIL